MNFGSLNFSSSGGGGGGVAGPFLDWIASFDAASGINPGVFVVRGADAETPGARYPAEPAFYFDIYNMRVGKDSFNGSRRVSYWAPRGSLDPSGVSVPVGDFKACFALPALARYQTPDGRLHTVRCVWAQNSVGATRGVQAFFQSLAPMGEMTQHGLIPKVQLVGYEQIPGGRGPKSRPTIAPSLQVAEWVDRPKLVNNRGDALLPDESPVADDGLGSAFQPPQAPAHPPAYPQAYPQAYPPAHSQPPAYPQAPAYAAPPAQAAPHQPPAAPLSAQAHPSGVPAPQSGMDVISTMQASGALNVQAPQPPQAPQSPPPQGQAPAWDAARQGPPNWDESQEAAPPPAYTNGAANGAAPGGGDFIDDEIPF